MTTSGSQPVPVDEHDLVVVERLDSRDDLDRPVLDRVDDLHIDDRRHPVAVLRPEHHALLGYRQPELGEVADAAPAPCRPGDHVGDPHRQVVERERDQIGGQSAGQRSQHEARRRAHRLPHFGRSAGRKVVGDLQRRRSRADDQHLQTLVRLRVAVVRRVDHLGEVVDSRPVRDVGNVLQSGRDDDLTGVDITCGRVQTPTAIASLDALHFGAQAQFDAVLEYVPVEMGHDFVATRKHRCPFGISPVRQMRKRPSGVQLQPVIPPAPRGTHVLGPVDQQRLQPAVPQTQRHRHAGRPGTDNCDVMLAHTPVQRA